MEGNQYAFQFLKNVCTNELESLITTNFLLITPVHFIDKSVVFLRY